MTEETNNNVELTPEQEAQVNTQNPIPPMPELTPEQQAALAQADKDIRDKLVAQLNEHYVNFIKQLINIPIDQYAKQNACKYFDTGFLWFEKGISKMQITPQAVNVEPQQDDAPSA